MMTMPSLTLRLLCLSSLAGLTLALTPLGASAQTSKPNVIAGRDYIVAVVDAQPITNHEVHVRANLLAQQLNQQKKTCPCRLIC